MEYRQTQGKELEKKLLELVPVELQVFLKGIQAFDRLVDEGKLLEENFKVPGVYSEEKAESLFKMLKESWAEIIAVDYFLPQHVQAPRKLCLLLMSPAKAEEFEE